MDRKAHSHAATRFRQEKSLMLTTENTRCAGGHSEKRNCQNVSTVNDVMSNTSASRLRRSHDKRPRGFAHLSRQINQSRQHTQPCATAVTLEYATTTKNCRGRTPDHANYFPPFPIRRPPSHESDSNRQHQSGSHHQSGIIRISPDAIPTNDIVIAVCHPKSRSASPLPQRRAGQKTDQ